MNAMLTAALLTAGLISPATAAIVAKTYSYFSISGSTLDAIRKQLDQRGPKVTGHRYPGATQMTFVNRIGYQTGRNGCSVASASVTVKAMIILPHWRRPRAATPEVRLVWDTLLADMKRHEEAMS
jgi:predicted secreted Zn-dependent protease